MSMIMAKIMTMMMLNNDADGDVDNNDDVIIIEYDDGD